MMDFVPFSSFKFYKILEYFYSDSLALHSSRGYTHLSLTIFFDALSFVRSDSSFVFGALFSSQLAFGRLCVIQNTSWTYLGTYQNEKLTESVYICVTILAIYSNHPPH